MKTKKRKKKNTDDLLLRDFLIYKFKIIGIFIINLLKYPSLPSDLNSSHTIKPNFHF
jgi:hypothetical protein